MEEQGEVSGGLSLISRSDSKIASGKQCCNELDLVERLDFCRKIQQLGPNLDSETTTLDSGKQLPVGAKIENPLSPGSLSSGIGAVNDSVSTFCGKQFMLEKSDIHCMTHKGTGLDLNGDSISSSTNDEFSGCSSRITGKSKSKDVLSECGSSNVPVEEKDPMKLWKAMKQNGFLSNPHGGISAASSCVVSSSHGGIPAPRKRSRKSKNDTMKNKKKIEMEKMEEVNRFAKIAAPTGLLNDLNPGIINHVRNRQQVLSIIRNIVRSESDSGNSLQSSNYEGNLRYGGIDNASTNLPETIKPLSSSEDSESFNRASVLTVKAATVASQWLELLHHDFKGRLSALRRSKKRVRSVITTELPFLIQKEFPSNQETDPNSQGRLSNTSRTVIHNAQWAGLFSKMEQTLSDEEKQLESWLMQVKELQSHCDQGLQHLSMSSGQTFLHLGMQLDSRSMDFRGSENELAVRAAAASVHSTCDFLMSKEDDISCT